jgi:hypothetical protein
MMRLLKYWPRLLWALWCGKVVAGVALSNLPLSLSWGFLALVIMLICTDLAAPSIRKIERHLDF